jgi:hypothetical protein
VAVAVAIAVAVAVAGVVVDCGACAVVDDEDAAVVEGVLVVAFTIFE